MATNIGFDTTERVSEFRVALEPTGLDSLETEQKVITESLSPKPKVLEFPPSLCGAAWEDIFPCGELWVKVSFAAGHQSKIKAWVSPIPAWRVRAPPPPDAPPARRQNILQRPVVCDYGSKPPNLALEARGSGRLKRSSRKGVVVPFSSVRRSCHDYLSGFYPPGDVVVYTIGSSLLFLFRCDDNLLSVTLFSSNVLRLAVRSFLGLVLQTCFSFVL